MDKPLFQNHLILHRRGQTTKLLKDRGDILDHLRDTEAQSASTDDEHRVRLQCICTALHLMMLETDEAVESLATYISCKNDKVVKNTNALKRLAKSNSLLAGLVLVQASNLQYRLARHYENGIALAEDAQRYFDQARAAVSRTDPKRVDIKTKTLNRQITLGKCNGMIWGARLRWKLGEKQEALKDLDVVTEKLQLEYEFDYKDDGKPKQTSDPGFNGRIDFLLGIAFEMQAAFYLSERNIKGAKASAFEALHMFDSNGCNDPIRYAYALITASRALSSSAIKQYSMATKLAHQAEHIFREHSHPFYLRAVLQQAQCFVKSKQTDRALDRLNFIGEKLDTIASKLEMSRIRAEKKLTAIWIYGDEAIDHIEPDANYKRIIFESDCILNDRENLPRRLEAEALLHLGIAQFRCSDQDIGLVEKSREHIQEALDISEDMNHNRIKMACHIALAESYTYGRYPSRADVAMHWDNITLLKEVVNSDYLSLWSDRLEPLFAQTLYGTVPIYLDQKYKNAQRAFDKAYFEFHWEKCNGTIKQFTNNTGIPKASLYRLKERVERN